MGLCLPLGGPVKQLKDLTELLNWGRKTLGKGKLLGGHLHVQGKTVLEPPRLQFLLLPGSGP